MSEWSTPKIEELEPNEAYDALMRAGMTPAGALALPAPITGPEIDVRDFDGFMLNVERLMASELVALSSPAEITAALFLWCRAWKQIPAASLPNDDRVLAAFSRNSEKNFKKIKNGALHGFVLCSDNRLHHRVLAAEAKRAFLRKESYKNKRLSENERLRKWRMRHHETADETNIETHDETRFARVLQGQYSTGKKDSSLRSESLNNKNKNSFYQNAAREAGAASPARGSRSAAPPNGRKRKGLFDEKELRKLEGKYLSKPPPKVSPELAAKLGELATRPGK